LTAKAVLGKPRRGRRGGFDLDPLPHVAADSCLAVQGVLRPVHRAAGMPGLFFEIRCLEEDEFVRTQSVEAAVVQLLRPHRRDEIAQVLDKLAVLQWTDLTRAER